MTQRGKAGWGGEGGGLHGEMFSLDPHCLLHLINKKENYEDNISSPNVSPRFRDKKKH